jgi:hypothetical protein
MEFEINDALSKPPRNCDVGNEEEQAERMERTFCSRQHGCGRCQWNSARYVDCALKWAQMPYEAKGEGEE